MIRTMWSDTFKAPPNDPRLMELTPREALEQVLAIYSLERRRSEAQEKRMEALNRRSSAGIEGPTATILPKERAIELADTPHLTGDPEFDAVELAETAPGKKLNMRVR